MVRGHYIAARHSDIRNGLRAVAAIGGGREAQRKRRGVGGIPPDPGNRRVVERVDERTIQVIRGLDPGQPDNPALGRVGIIRVAGERADSLLEKEDISRVEVGPGALERGLRAARRKAAVRIAPGVEGDLVVLQEQRGARLWFRM